MGQPLDKYLKKQVYDLIQWLRQGEQMSLQVPDPLNHLQVHKLLEPT